VLAGAAGQPALDHRSHRAVRVRRRGRFVVPVVGEPLTRRAALAQALGLTAAATGAIAGVSLLTRGAVPARAVAAKPVGTAVADSAALAAGDAIGVMVQGSPALVIRGADGGLSAFSAVCTYAGCDVVWQDGEIRCPCHHARFDPGTGEPTKGPAQAPLTSFEVVERDGKIVLA
jgi:nitrite reductase/ring-hydroxylating ferredoxin subunit